MSTAALFQRRVLLHLQAGRSYNDAMHLATMPAPVAPLGARQQPQSPAHVTPAAVAAGLAATGISRVEMDL